VHKTLETTPAIALGITDHVWSIGELIDAALTAVPPLRHRIAGDSFG
jgi:hypothetical protein